MAISLTIDGKKAFWIQDFDEQHKSEIKEKIEKIT